MKSGLLTQYMGVGFPHLREMSGLPDDLLPDFAAVTRQLGDEGMLRLAEPLGLGESIKSLLAQAHDPVSLPPEIWQHAIAHWPPLPQVLSVTMALLRACEKVDALERRGALKIDFLLIRGLAVVAYAPFTPNGRELLGRVADILGSTVLQPAGLLDRYMMAVVRRDTDTLADLDRCIREDPAWREWSDRFLATGKDFPFLPKVIGISPPLTGGLKQVLVNMMMEVLNAHHSRNYSN